MFARLSLIYLMLILIPAVIVAKDHSLIINPKLEGGIGAFPIGAAGFKLVNGDTVEDRSSISKTTHYNYKEMYPDGVDAVALMITGKVPDPSRRWMVAVTRDREQFENSFAEYRNLMARGKRREAAGTLHISRGMRVGTRVVRYHSEEGKVGEVAEKVGNFIFEFDIDVFEKYGGYLTFLSYRPGEGDDIVDFGYGIDDTVHGELIVEKCAKEDKKDVGYRMKVVKAGIKGNYRPGRYTEVVK